MSTIKFETRVVREAPIVKAEWIDAQHDPSGWQSFDSNEVVQNVMISIGYLIEEDAEKVSIVPHVGLSIAGMPTQMSGRIIITRRQLTTLTVLQEARSA